MVIPQFYFQATVTFLVATNSFWIFGTNCKSHDIFFGSSPSLGARDEEGFGNFVSTLSLFEQINLMNEIKELGKKIKLYHTLVSGVILHL